MVWHLDVTGDEEAKVRLPLAKRDLRPMAMEWGGQVFEIDKRRSAFAVATGLSNVCRLLNVELVTDLSRGVSGYWGRTGHYSIAALAIELVGDKTLRKFLKANAGILSFDLDAITQKDFDKSVGQIGDGFVPLADVPDEIWKKLDHGKNPREGGRDTSGGPHGSTGPEHPNHYADIDAVVGKNGETIRALSLADGANLTPKAWLAFYKKLGDDAKEAGDTETAKQYHSKLKQGLLPFRLWQFFDAMAGFLEKKDVVGFLTAAGTAAHYMGDASQPLHGSIYADGDDTRTATREHPQSGTSETVPFGKGVHSAYETAMVSRHADKLIGLIQKRLKANPPNVPLCKNGKAVARATVTLMDKAAKILPPLKILESYEKAGAGTRIATLDALWDDFSDETAQVMALGAANLAMLWESAWKEGSGAAVPASKLKRLAEKEVRKRYIDPDFVPSVTLDKIGPLLS
jgi:hypothetical protein